jgi:hypothetical protein
MSQEKKPAGQNDPRFCRDRRPIGECHAGLAAPALSRNTPKGQAGRGMEAREAGL